MSNQISSVHRGAQQNEEKVKKEEAPNIKVSSSFIRSRTEHFEKEIKKQINPEIKIKATQQSTGEKEAETEAAAPKESKGEKEKEKEDRRISPHIPSAHHRSDRISMGLLAQVGKRTKNLREQGRSRSASDVEALMKAYQTEVEQTKEEEKKTEAPPTSTDAAPQPTIKRSRSFSNPLHAALSKNIRDSLPITNKKVWRARAIKMFEAFAKKEIAAGETSKRAIIKKFVKSQGLTTTTIHKRIADYKSTPGLEFLAAFAKINDPKEFIIAAEKLDKKQYRMLMTAIGGEEVIDCLKLTLSKKMQKRAKEIVKKIQLLNSLPDHIDMLKDDFRSYFDHDRPVCNTSYSDVVDSFRAFYITGPVENHPSFYLNGKPIVFPEVKGEGTKDRKLPFLTTLIATLNEALGVESRLTASEQAELLFSETLKQSIETPLEVAAQEIPCFRILQALSINAYSKALYAMQSHSPELVHTNKDQPRLKSFADVVTHYDVTVDPKTKKFDVTHIKAHQIIEGGTLNNEVFATLDANWCLHGGYGNNHFTASFWFKDLVFSEDKPVEKLLDIGKKLKLYG